MTDQIISSKFEWVERCAAYLRIVAGVGQPISLHIAEACWLNALDGCGTEPAVLAESPEAAADDEMYCWGGD